MNRSIVEHQKKVKAMNKPNALQRLGSNLIRSSSSPAEGMLPSPSARRSSPDNDHLDKEEHYDAFEAPGHDGHRYADHAEDGSDHCSPLTQAQWDKEALLRSQPFPFEPRDVRLPEKCSQPADDPVMVALDAGAFDHVLTPADTKQLEKQRHKITEPTSIKLLKVSTTLAHIPHTDFGQGTLTSAPPTTASTELAWNH